MLQKRIMWALVLTLFLIPTQLVPRALAVTATVGINPPISTVPIGDTFTLNITVSNINNFTCWEFRLYYLNSVLNCTAADEGPFLQNPTGTFFNKTITNNYNSSYGQLWAYDTIEGKSYTVNGSGVIATVTFKAVGGGSTYLNFSGINLGDEKIPAQPIPYTATGGNVSVTGGTHDIAVTNIVSSKIVVFQNSTININVSFANNGNSIETFNATCFANTTLVIQNQTIYNMPSGTSSTIIFVWNTTGFARGNYSLSAYAWPVPGETNTADNNLTGGWVFVSMVGDLTGGTKNPWDFVPDGKVDGKDIAIVALCFGSAPGSPPPYTWNANCDVNNDAKVDGKDIALVALHFGQADP